MTLRKLLQTSLLIFGALTAPVLWASDAVNINTASAEELAAALDGVGLSRAQAIIDYREKFGPFEDIYELVNVRGIGERTVDLNEAKLQLQ